MKQSLMLSLIQNLEFAFRETGARANAQDAERIACIVYRSMGNPNREFHNIGHVLGFLPNQDPEFILAAIFHDIVYYQVDGGFPADLTAILGPWCSFKDGKPDLAWPQDLVPPPPGTPEELIAGVPLAASAHRECLLLCARVFGLKPGDSLIGRPGFNEFYSCLAMAILLRPLCSETTILGVAACIEQSLPFRSPDQAGHWSQEHLAQRLEDLLLAQGSAPVQAHGQAVAMVHRAIDFANQDVTDFGAQDVTRFISGTWRLLPELNRSLRVQGHCTIGEYRKAMQGMIGFFASLQPERIFHCFDNKPSGKELAEVVQRAERNLVIALDYLRAKLMGTAFLEAAAWFTGGDLPLAYVMGDIPREGEETRRIDQFLHYPLHPRCQKTEVYHLLKVGRAGKSGFDLSNSPLSLFFYESFDQREFAQATQACTTFLKSLDSLIATGPARQEAAIGPLCRDWLASLPTHLVREVLQALGQMAPTRKTALEALYR